MIGLARAVTGEDDQISYCDHISSTRLAPFIFQRFHELLGLMTQTCYLAFSVTIKTFLRSYQHGIDSRDLLNQMNGLVLSIELAQSKWEMNQSDPTEWVGLGYSPHPIGDLPTKMSPNVPSDQ